jgi:RNA polymerase sigma factor (sigma-70 family)
MKKLSSVASAGRPRRMMVAMVLGTALSSMGASVAQASPKTVTDISRYCTACWRNARLPADCWSDCTQDVFVRLLERVPAESWEKVLQLDGEERREFVRAIDAVKKRVQRGRHHAAWPADGIADERAFEERSQAERREVIAQAAKDVLSSRQRSILDDTVRGYSVPEIADRLGTTPERVSDEKYKAIRKLRDILPTAL